MLPLFKTLEFKCPSFLATGYTFSPILLFQSDPLWGSFSLESSSTHTRPSTYKHIITHMCTQAHEHIPEAQTWCVYTSSLCISYSFHEAATLQLTALCSQDSRKACCLPSAVLGAGESTVRGLCLSGVFYSRAALFRKAPLNDSNALHYLRL